MKYFFWWLYAAVPATLVLGAAYVMVQQQYRVGLNDPQIEMAEEGAARLAQGGVPAELVVRGAPLVDIADSLSPWLVVYDANGTGLEASGQLDNAPPQLPAGVFDVSTWLKHDNGRYYNQSPLSQTRFTWQPREGVRQAVVLVQTPDKKYFVAAGRSMREGEQRIEHAGELAFVAWLATLGAILAVQLLYVFAGRAARGGARGS